MHPIKSRREEKQEHVRDTDNIKKTQTEPLVMKNTIPGMKNRLDTEEEKTDELEDTAKETLNNESRRKKTDKNKLGFEELWEDAKRPNIYPTGVLKKEERGKERKGYLEK